MAKWIREEKTGPTKASQTPWMNFKSTLLSSSLSTYAEYSTLDGQGNFQQVAWQSISTASTVLEEAKRQKRVCNRERELDRLQ